MSNQEKQSVSSSLRADALEWFFAKSETEKEPMGISFHFWSNRENVY